MKIKIGLYLLSVSLFFLSAHTTAIAHPGRTAADGCHYCRTNCDKWGVAWNERHCHGGSLPKINTQVINEVVPTRIPPTRIPPTKRPIVIPTKRPTSTPKPTSTVTSTPTISSTSTPIPTVVPTKPLITSPKNTVKQEANLSFWKKLFSSLFKTSKK